MTTSLCNNKAIDVNQQITFSTKKNMTFTNCTVGYSHTLIHPPKKYLYIYYYYFFSNSPKNSPINVTLSDMSPQAK